MVDKGFLKYRGEGKKYIYYPAVARDKASRSALNSVLQTFFSGSVAQAVVSLINLHKDNLTAEDLDRLSKLIDETKTAEAKKEGEGHDDVH
jgi:BlaI family transcriptional regulator, penicillinase repressor